MIRLVAYNFQLAATRLLVRQVPHAEQAESGAICYTLFSRSGVKEKVHIPRCSAHHPIRSIFPASREANSLRDRLPSRSRNFYISQASYFTMGIIEKGNTIFIPAPNLIEKTITVEWSQNFQHRSQEYYIVPCYNKSKGITLSSPSLYHINPEHQVYPSILQFYI